MHQEWHWKSRARSYTRTRKLNGSCVQSGVVGAEARYRDQYDRNQPGASHCMFLIECGLVLIAVVFAFAAPTTGSRFFEAVERPFSGLARRQRMAVVAVRVIALGVHAIAPPMLRIPFPGLQERFS